MTQTAVEFLFNELWELPKDKFNWNTILSKAKEMEKKQIMDAVEYHIDLLNEIEISNNEIKLASIERLKIRLESSENIQIASADALGFFIGAEWYREQLKNKI